MSLSTSGISSKVFILDVEVVGPLRGQGFGREIMNAAIRECHEREIELVGLSVFGFNIVARNLYLSFGFQIVEEILWKEL